MFFFLQNTHTSLAENGENLISVQWKQETLKWPLVIPGTFKAETKKPAFGSKVEEPNKVKHFCAHMDISSIEEMRSKPVRL